MANKAELIYFDGRGFAEIIRLVLTAAGIEYTERDLHTREEFLALVPELLFGQVPLLRIDGMNIVQSNPIVRHVARKAHLLGEKEPDVTQIDILYQGARDLLMAIFVGIVFSQDESKLHEHKPMLIKYLTIFNKVLHDNGTGYLVGKSLTVADLAFLEVVVSTVEYFGKETLNDYSDIQKFQTTVSSLERVAKYLKEIRKPKNTPEYVAECYKVLGRVP